jgi:hypothetical protein
MAEAREIPTFRCLDCPELQSREPGVGCRLRDARIAAPGASFCANHPDAGPPAADLPVGPVLRARGGAAHIVVLSPDTPPVREVLLAIVDDCPVRRVAEMSLREEVALWQLANWGERRSFVLQDRFDRAPALPGTADSGPGERTVGPAGPFRSSARRARVAVVLLALSGLAALASVVSDQLQVALFERMELGEAGAAEAEVNDERQALIGLCEIVLLVPTAIAFLAWVHRAYANLRPLGARRLRRSPGAAVAVWFIPFANLVLPHTVVAEIAEHSSAPGERPLRGLVLGWWLSWLAAGVIGNASARLMTQGAAIDELVLGTRYGQVAGIATVVSAWLAIQVVRSIVRRQDSRPDRVAAAFD